jgi:purine catabolism regulator
MAAMAAPSHSGDGITVERALQLPSLRRGKPRVLAARAQLTNRIRWVHSSEVPDVARLLVGGELLLTTGMGMGRTALDQRRFVRSVGASGVAGLIVELGRSFSELPQAMVTEAERSGVLLIALEREVPFVEVTREIHTTIVDAQVSTLQRADELNRRFMLLMLEGADIPEVLTDLAADIRNPVILEKSDATLLYHHGHRSEDAAVMAAWEVRRDAVPGGEDYDDVSTVSRLVPADGRRTWGRLVALGLESPLSDFDRLAIERAATIVGLTMQRARQEALLASRERGNFLADVIAGRIDPADAQMRALSLGFDDRGGLLLPIAIAPTTAGDAEPGWTSVRRALRDALEQAALPVLLGSARPDELLLLAGLSAVERRGGGAETVARTLQAAGERHLGRADIGVVAVGAAVDGWDGLPGAFQEASNTAQLARSAPARAWHDATVVDIDRLLVALHDEPNMRDFVARRLGAVIEHDRKRSAKLMPTLEALCEHGWRKADTARVLHLDRKSLYPRIERLEKLIGSSLDDQKTRLSLELAVRAWRRDQR